MNDELTNYNDQPSIDRSLARKALGTTVFAATAISWIFEQSPANEALRADIAFDVLDRTRNALAVGGIVGAVSFLIEMVPASLVAIGLNQKESAIDRFVQKRIAKNSSTDETNSNKEKKHNKLTDFGIAMGIGAAAVVGKRHLSDREPSFKNDMSNAVQASEYVAVGSGAVGFLAGGGIRYAEKIGLEDQAQFVIDRGTDWKTWVAFVAIIQTPKILKAATRKTKLWLTR
jgi:hypothetical protein